MFELQPLYDSRQSFYGKAFVERYATNGGTKLVLGSYGTIVAVVSPVGETADGTEVHCIEIEGAEAAWRKVYVINEL
mgnify:CR=1 FL=1